MEMLQSFGEKNVEDSIGIALNDLESIVRDAKEASLSKISSLHPPGIIPPTIRFLKNFILFASSFQGFVLGQLEDDLFIQVECSVVYFACLVLEFVLVSSNQFDFHESMRRIEPFEPHVCEIYVGVLQHVLELSLRESIPHGPHPSPDTLVLQNFIDSLLFLLLKLLFFGPTSHWYTFNHHIRKLYKGLEFLKISLRENHGYKVGDRYLPSICEAGTIVCYLFVEKGDGRGMVENLELLFSAFEEKIKLIKGAEEQPPRYSLASASCFPQTNLPGFIDSLLEKIKSVNVYEANSSIIVSGEDEFQAIHNDLSSLRSFLVDVVQKTLKNGQLKALWGRVAAIAYETDFAIDSVLVQRDLQSFVIMLHTIVEEVNLIKVEISECSHGEGKILEFPGIITKTHSKLSSSISKLPEFSEHAVGLDDETQNIVDQLTRGTKQLDIVSIVGMAGIGKTTLANKVYRHHSIVHHFYVRSWCRVSQVYNKKNCLLEILRGLDDESADKYLEMNEHDLALKLYRSLKGKTYLVILDDVWDVKAWSDLQNSFPDDIKGSRILLTSRHENVALQIKRQTDPHHLQLLTDDESWELFKMKLVFPSELHDSGKAIVKRCKGLPLMIVVIAGLLSKMEPSTWEEVEESLKNGKDQCIDAIAMSYSHLPPHLKLCFLYFAAYAEDQKFSVREMIWLWIAEGFVEKNGRECIEDVAEGYVIELIQRNLVMVAGKEFGSRVKFCMLHDLIHEFCLKKANEEHFLHHLHGSELENSIDQCTLYRLRVCSSKVEDFIESRLECPRLRTLFFLTDYNERLPFLPPWYGILYKFCQSNFLGVLDLTGIFEFKSFPLVILQLVRLRYLALSTGDHWEIPLSIEHLSNLETFIVQGGDVSVFLPSTVWNLKKLRHLCRISRSGWAWELSIENPKCLSYLENLQVFSKVEFSCYQTMKEVIKKSPNIRILKCSLILRGDNTKCTEEFKIIALDCLNQLESLWLKDLFQAKLDLHFQFPHNLKKLTLIGFGLPWSRIATIDRLPNLEVLKLVRRAFEGQDWHMDEEEEEEEDGTFPRLRFLKLEDLDLARWTGCDDNFPCLEVLVLKDCDDLVELPSCLATSSTLLRIEVTDCKHVAGSIREILEMQMDLGNEDLKILRFCHLFKIKELCRHICFEAAIREIPVLKHHFRDVKCSLGVMRTIFQYRMIWDEDAGNESALCTMAATVLKCSLEIQLLYLTLEEAGNDHAISENRWNRFSEFLQKIVESIWQGMEETFDIVSDVVRKRKTSSSSHSEMGELLNIIDAILHILPKFVPNHFGACHVDYAIVSVKFLKKSILFAAFKGLEHRQTQALLVHIQASVFDLARSIFAAELLGDHYDHFSKSIESIDAFLSHDVCDIYLGYLHEVLELPQSSIHHLTPGSNALESLVAFVGSLRSFLFRIAFHCEFHLYTFDLHIRKLCEGLEFMKTALREHQDKVGDHYEKMPDLIPPLICEAGVIIFNLIRGNEVEGGMVKKLEPLFSDFEEKLELIMGPKEVASGYSLDSPSYFPQTNLLGLWNPSWIRFGQSILMGRIQQLA
ncbi:OLC1v1038185C1 [Oldenlandia corymbosa var. corymbosa]|uniref:OLC1v1038185C1 n=1 Tax=Oldenlandia corymbosa var. corymbosa TaxID=529605 RepID=A0AAV1CZ80_OLDCO|nr:OLC1v1038185C1 [Oldenlandia corymbosa var. corymbosa]